MQSDIAKHRAEIHLHFEHFCSEEATKFKFDSINLSRIEFLALLFNTETRERILRQLNMTEQEKLFASFFSQAYNKGVSIGEMSFEELGEWIKELEKTIFEAKATLQGAAQAKRERIANLAASEREKLISPSNESNGSDALASIKKRKDRMSKLEKLEETYRGLGMSDEDIKTALALVKVSEELPISNPKKVNEEAVKASNEGKPSLLDKIVDSIINTKPKDETPFDPDDLFK